MKELPSPFGPSRGIYLGTARVFDGFTVDIDADVVRPLTPGARNLYLAMRWLANGQTGELAINGNALTWEYIAKQAGISGDSWQKYLRELRARREGNARQGDTPSPERLFFASGKDT